MSGSLSVAVRKAVTSGLRSHLSGLAAFNSQANEHEVAVSYGFDSSSVVAEQVYAARSRGDTPAASMKSGRNFRNEEGTFDLIVRVKYTGGNLEDSDARAFEIGAVCEEWIADRKSNELGIDGLNWLVVDGWESDNGADDSGAATLLIYTVRWNARLT